MGPDPLPRNVGLGSASVPSPTPRGRGLLRLLPRRLAPRLIVGTALLVAFGHMLSTWLIVGTLKEHFLQARTVSADNLSRSITTATRHLMMANRKEDAYALMGTIGEAQGIADIQIFSRTGKVAFRTGGPAGESLSIQAGVCQVCHVSDPPRDLPDAWQRSRFLERPDGGRDLAIVTPIANEPGCSTALCHAHDPQTKVLGVLELTMDVGDVDNQIAALRTPAFLLTLGSILLVTTFLGLVIAQLVARPLKRLVRGTRAVADMAMTTPIAVGSTTELAELADSFNRMQVRLKEALDANARSVEDLEAHVEARSRELQRAREQLVESDRLASLGKLAASVAHEVNNPLSAVLNLSVFLQRLLTDAGVPPDRLPAFRRHLQQIAEETARAGRIVTDLLAFSRRGMPRRSPSDLNQVVQKTLELVGHRVHLSHVRLERELDPHLPLVPCDPSQVEQILLNLVINAVEALKHPGRIVVRTRVGTAEDVVVVEVEDDGPGMPPAVLRRAFDPFFSTKTDGKGVGLGLSVAYGIAQAHGGSLSVVSEEGRRTVFTLKLPLHPRENPEETSP